ncbi:nickel-type superoxide dismutase maturation protease [Candidatus Poseidonia alphae]|uniref:nickel-type superoxide dismutase maturation protease n=1 Tax=Candidatus Poseidonia alphae TaxID=1915863 RepID=UPI00230A1BA2|nr:nickel-type superoxide dismutase maturation protease [Candidatus Poseidonia alphae]MDA8749223.1 nickel-type superoxide dismutase maturation protease [Candidatus Poseidonia alphae]MDB2335195.1 nickel-type superoxide dismutase maturation protease [Candidatus Poseidonia alphae]
MSEPFQVRIKGDSMWPTFSDGDTLTFAHLLDQHHVDAGVVVLAKHPLKLDVLVVKRVHSVEPDGRFFLVGDQPDPLGSEDSHNFGPVHRSAIVGYLLE